MEGAEWSPDGRELAVIRRAGNRVRLEYPIGTMLHETTGWLNNLRFSPDGRSVAFIEHPERGDNAGWLLFFDLTKRSLVQGPRVPGTSAFAWSPRGEVVIGGGGIERGHSAEGLDCRQGSSLGLARRRVHVRKTSPRTGGFSPKRINYRREIIGAAGDSRERKLSWLNWSYPDDISNDGTTLLFDEQTLGRDNYLCYIRKTDGSPAVLLGHARGVALSQDGAWALTINADSSQLTLLPTGAGSPKPLPKTGLSYQWATFFPNGTRLLLSATEPGKGSRLYRQEIDGGTPRPITPEGFDLPYSGKPISPDGRTVVALAPNRKVHLLPMDGGESRPLPGTLEGDNPCGWTADGRSLYVLRAGMPARVDVLDVATGARRLWKELTPPDPAGILAIGPVLVTPDGKSYVYSYRRMLDDLFMVTGLE